MIACRAIVVFRPLVYRNSSKFFAYMTNPVLSESEYDSLAQPELQRLIDSLDTLSNEELEAELASDILTIEFSDGARYVLNSHRAARQIWLSAERAAWHFDFLPARQAWVAAKTGDELWSTLTRLLSDKLGEPITLGRS
jgi:CyaY protein